MRQFVFSLLLALLFAAPAHAQSAVATAEAPVFLQPGHVTPLRTAAPGTVFKVLSDRGDWVQVEFNDPQFGRRVGWVERKLLRVERPELKPMDLSVKESQPIERAEAPALAAQPRVSSGLSRGWIDVNFGIANSADKTVVAESTAFDEGGEPITARVSYQSPRGASFDFGGGYWFSQYLGAGIAFTGTAHESPATLYINLPHPLFFNRFASDEGETDDALMRTEGGVNLSLAARFPAANERLVTKVFGGPTYFRLKADAVNDIIYDQAFFGTAHAVSIEGYESDEIEETAWGFHAGFDIGYFFTRVVGIGGTVRFSQGEVEIDDADLVGNDSLKVKVGGTQIAGGLRIKL